MRPEGREVQARVWWAILERCRDEGRGDSWGRLPILGRRRWWRTAGAVALVGAAAAVLALVAR